jgi:hypothetical protein
VSRILRPALFAGFRESLHCIFQVAVVLVAPATEPPPTDLTSSFATWPQVRETGGGGWSGVRPRPGLRWARDLAPERELLHSSFLTEFGLRGLL